MSKRSSIKSVTVLISIVTLAACTEPGEMTGIGAATGGVVGAGLGAIVGNQTGNAGSGLVIGATAGAGAGAAIGNVLEAQDQAIRQQDEAIERQEQVIRAQRGELDELRRLGQDSVRFRGKTPVKSPAYVSRSAQTAGREGLVLRDLPTKPPMKDTQSFQAAPAPRAYAGRPAPAIAPSNAISFRDVPKPVSQPVVAQPEVAASEDMTGDAVVAEVNSIETAGGIAERDVATRDLSTQTNATRGDAGVPDNAIAAGNVKPSGDCLSAESEFQQAANKSENPDKLFHIRRALRLCPDDSRFHASLGDIYTALGRGSDAKFEYQEALRLAPGNLELKKKIESLPGDTTEQY